MVQIGPLFSSPALTLHDMDFPAQPGACALVLLCALRLWPTLTLCAFHMTRHRITRQDTGKIRGDGEGERGQKKKGEGGHFQLTPSHGNNRVSGIMSVLQISGKIRHRQVKWQKSLLSKVCWLEGRQGLTDTAFTCFGRAHFPWKCPGSIVVCSARAHTLHWVRSRWTSDLGVGTRVTFCLWIRERKTKRGDEAQNPARDAGKISRAQSASWLAGIPPPSKRD